MILKSQLPCTKPVFLSTVQIIPLLNKEISTTVEIFYDLNLMNMLFISRTMYTVQYKLNCTVQLTLYFTLNTVPYVHWKMYRTLNTVPYTALCTLYTSVHPLMQPTCNYNSTCKYNSESWRKSNFEIFCRCPNLHLTFSY